MDDQQMTPQEPLAVRVDLTSHDLRTGTIRLPRQLHGQFPAGQLTATGQDTNQTYLLDSEPPSQLSGLQPFIAENDLRTNDAVVIHVDGLRLRLQPYFRRPQQPAKSVAESDAGETESTAVLDHEPLIGPASAGDSLDTASRAAARTEVTAEPASLDQPENAPTDQAQGLETPAVSGPHPADEQRPTATVSEEQSAEAPMNEPFEDTEPVQPAFDSFDAFDSLSELGELEPDDFDLREPEFTADSGSTATEYSDGSDVAAGAVTGSEYHAVQRRPFGAAQLNTNAQALAPGAPFPQSSEQDLWKVPADAGTPGPGTAAENDNEGARMHTVAPGQVSTQGEILDFLDSPTAPSILNVKDVARQLNQDEAAVEASLESLASQAESRVSRVRPGFYLLKRQRA